MAPFCSQNIVLLCPARGTAVPRYGRRRRKGANAAKCRAPGMCKAKTPPQQTGYPSQSAPAISGMLKPHPCRNSRSTGTDTVPASGRTPQPLAGKARSPGFAPRRPGYARPKHRIKSRSATKPETPRKHQGAEKPETPRSSRNTEAGTAGRNAASCNRKPEPQAGTASRNIPASGWQHGGREAVVGTTDSATPESAATGYCCAICTKIYSTTSSSDSTSQSTTSCAWT